MIFFFVLIRFAAARFRQLFATPLPFHVFAFAPPLFAAFAAAAAAASTAAAFITADCADALAFLSAAAVSRSSSRFSVALLPVFPHAAAFAAFFAERRCFRMPPAADFGARYVLPMPPPLHYLPMMPRFAIRCFAIIAISPHFRRQRH